MLSVEILILSLVALFLYSGLYWFTCLRRGKKSESVWFFSGSFACVVILGMGMWLNLFWVLFLAVLLLTFAAYLGANKKYTHGIVIKNGVFGGFWLIVPVYAQVVSSI